MRANKVNSPSNKRLPLFRIGKAVSFAGLFCHFPASSIRRSRQFGKRVERRKHLVVFQHRQIPYHAEIRLARGLTHHRLIVVEAMHTDTATSASTANASLGEGSQPQSVRRAGSAAMRARSAASNEGDGEIAGRSSSALKTARKSSARL